MSTRAVPDPWPAAHDGLKDDTASTWSSWFDKVLHSGFYDHSWYSSSNEKDFWHTFFAMSERIEDRRP